MKKRILFAPAIAAAALAGGTAASAEPTPPPPTQSAPQDGGDRQEPSYTGSVPLPQTQGTGQSEAQEGAALAGLAKVTSDQAKAAAQARYPNATLRSVALDDENGWLVWSVDLLDGTTSRDVKVDAGNGTILAVDSGDANETGDKGGAQKQGVEGPETAETGD